MRFFPLSIVLLEPFEMCEMQLGNNNTDMKSHQEIFHEVCLKGNSLPVWYFECIQHFEMTVKSFNKLNS